LRKSGVIKLSKTESQFGQRRLLISVEGAAGRGKTSAAKHFCERHGGLIVHGREIWKGVSPMLHDFAHVLCGWHLELHSTAALYARVVEEIIEKQVAFIVIDEADYCDRGAAMTC
jgi:DNA transposition AAA+ family ATPase